MTRVLARPHDDAAPESEKFDAEAAFFSSLLVPWKRDAL